MEDFEEIRHHNMREATFIVRPELRFHNDDDYLESTFHNTNGLPTLILQLELSIEDHFWSKQRDNPSQLIYKPEYHHTYTLSFDLKLCPHQYSTHGVFYSKLEEEIGNWGGNDSVIKHMIIRIHKLIEDGLNKCGGSTNCRYLDIIVDMNVQLEWVWDVRIEELPSLPSSPKTSTSIIELPERMEIDDDQCLKDIDCVICIQQLEGEKIVCMPCSHMFHTSCIKIWLDKSHYCPICRYNVSSTS